MTLKYRWLDNSEDIGGRRMEKRNHQWKTFAFIGMTVFIVGLIAGCSNSDYADEEEGKLTLYNGKHKDATSALIEAFRSEERRIGHQLSMLFQDLQRLKLIVHHEHIHYH